MNIEVWNDESKSWSVVENVPADQTLTQLKAWLRGNGLPGKYRIIAVKWGPGVLAPKNDTLLMKS